MVEEKKPIIGLDISSPISFKAEVKAEIPKKSTGRLVDAVTDAIRPFTERRGLKADQIRLQREDILIQIARKTAERLSIEGKSPGPVPNKFLIPFMEKASLENEESDLIDTWAKLLATAAQNYDTSLIRYISVLAELGGREVRFLDRLIKTTRSSKPLHFVTEAPVGFSEWRVSDYLDDFVFESKTKAGGISEKKSEAAFARLVKELEVPGGILEVVGIETIEFQHPTFKIHDPEDEAAIAILQSLGIVIRQVITTRRQEPFCFSECLHLTAFGLGFCTACDPELARAIAEAA